MVGAGDEPHAGVDMRVTAMSPCTLLPEFAALAGLGALRHLDLDLVLFVR